MRLSLPIRYVYPILLCLCNCTHYTLHATHFERNIPPESPLYYRGVAVFISPGTASDHGYDLQIGFFMHSYSYHLAAVYDRPSKFHLAERIFDEWRIYLGTTIVNRGLFCAGYLFVFMLWTIYNTGLFGPLRPIGSQDLTQPGQGTILAVFLWLIIDLNTPLPRNTE